MGPPGATRATTLIGVVALLLLVAPWPAHPTQGDDRAGQLGIRLLEGPAGGESDPRAAQFVVDHVPPGSEFTRRYVLWNSTDRDLDIHVYVGDAEIRDGRWRTLPGRGDRELTAWVRPEQENVRVPAGGEVEQTFTVRVPEDAAAGERYGVLWAETPTAGDTVAAANRVGIRFYLSVGPGGGPPTDFEIDSLTALRDEEGRAVVRARVENTGGRAIDLLGELELSEGPAGLTAGPFPAEGGTSLAPGDEGSMTVVLDPELPSGPWLARMVARSGSLEKAAEATIVFPDEVSSASPPVPAQEVPLHRDRSFLIPVALGLLILSLSLVLLMWLLARRRRQDEEEPPAVAAATGVVD